jgi:hypothetical protein
MRFSRCFLAVAPMGASLDIVMEDGIAEADALIRTLPSSPLRKKFVSELTGNSVSSELSCRSSALSRSIRLRRVPRRVVVGIISLRLFGYIGWFADYVVETAFGGS